MTLQMNLNILQMTSPSACPTTRSWASYFHRFSVASYHDESGRKNHAVIVAVINWQDGSWDFEDAPSENQRNDLLY